MSKGFKRKKGNYYAHGKSKKARSRFVLEPGLKGFLCTCNNREKECIRECYNILNEYADQIYGEEKFGQTEESDNGDSTDEDIDNALQKEVQNMKAEKEKAPSQRRFQVIESGAKNCLFIRTTVEDPVLLVSTILKELEETKKQKTRYLLRLLPIEETCKAWPEDITPAVDRLLDKYFMGGEGKTYSVLFNRRNNNNVPRDEVIKEIALGIRQRNPLHQADLKNPQFSIIVEIIRNMCCLAVLPNYFRYKKYNLLEVCAEQKTVKESRVDNDSGKAEETSTDQENNEGKDNFYKLDDCSLKEVGNKDHIICEDKSKVETDLGRNDTDKPADSSSEEKVDSNDNGTSEEKPKIDTDVLS